MRTISLFLMFLFILPACSLAAEQAWTWAKGNLHCHTTNSDGDSSPNEVSTWYRENGYDFLFITDHCTVTDPVTVDSGGLLLIPGEEMGTSLNKLPIHMNALGTTSAIPSKTGLTSHRIIKGNIDQIRAAGGIPMVNHPNFHWAFNHRQLLLVDRPYLLEIYNAHPFCYSSGDIARLSVEQMWDVLLSAGHTVYATATDDAHHYKEFNAGRANPGRGWVYVKVKELNASEVLSALDRGDFYSSTGVELENVHFTGRALRVTVKPKENTTYVIRFVGKHGEILSEVDGTDAEYRVPDDPDFAYVRAKVISQDGKAAWTQAFRRKTK